MRLPELSFSFLHGAQTIQKTQKKHLLNARCFFVLLNVVEPGGFEPPSASTPLSVLHA